MPSSNVTLKDIYAAIKELREEVNNNFVRKETWHAEIKRLETMVQDSNDDVTELREQLMEQNKKVIAVAASISAVLAAAGSELLGRVIN